MAEPSRAPQYVAEFTLDPQPNCPRCANKIAQVRVDAVLETGEVDATGPELITTLKMSGQSLTALPCGCVLDGGTDG